MNDYSINNNFYNQSLDAHVTQVMKRVYFKMFLALLVTAGIAAYFRQSLAVISFMAKNSWAYWGLALVELGLVLGISGGINRISSSVASLLFYLFAIVNGATLSIIFAVYDISSIFKTFLITAGVFGAMSVYGYTTAKDLTKFGSFLMMALFGLIICIVINIFMKSTQLDWIISIIGVLIFIGLTAWDTQKIKQMAATSPGATDGRLATLGALSLYLDFINLFLYLLRFFGASRD